MNPAAPALSAAARAAGTILAAGYVTDLVPGPVKAMIGALALVDPPPGSVFRCPWRRGW